MSARSGLVGKKSSRPYLGPSEAIFSIGRKNPKNAKILPISLGGPMGPLRPVWGTYQEVSRRGSGGGSQATYQEQNLASSPWESLWLYMGGRVKLLPIPPPRVDSSKGPHQVNRAHWPMPCQDFLGKMDFEKMSEIYAHPLPRVYAIFLFFRSMEEMASDGPK